MKPAAYVQHTHTHMLCVLCPLWGPFSLSFSCFWSCPPQQRSLLSRGIRTVLSAESGQEEAFTKGKKNTLTTSNRVTLVYPLSKLLSSLMSKESARLSSSSWSRDLLDHGIVSSTTRRRRRSSAATLRRGCDSECRLLRRTVVLATFDEISSGASSSPFLLSSSSPSKEHPTATTSKHQSKTSYFWRGTGPLESCRRCL